MEGGKDRILIPSTILLIAAAMSLWFSAGLNHSPLVWFDVPKDTASLVGAMVAVGVANLGFGYICNALFVAWMFFWRKERFSDFERLVTILGKNKSESDRDLERTSLCELHYRLHSQAPQSLVEWTIRRNSAWYIAKTSTFASILGWLLALLVIMNSEHSSCDALIGLAISFFLFSIFLPVTLWRQGTKWNIEFWDVVLMWLQQQKSEKTEQGQQAAPADA